VHLRTLAAPEDRPAVDAVLDSNAAALGYNLPVADDALAGCQAPEQGCGS
jgi:hypothetical protein